MTDSRADVRLLDAKLLGDLLEGHAAGERAEDGIYGDARAGYHRLPVLDALVDGYPGVHGYAFP